VIPVVPTVLLGRGCQLDLSRPAIMGILNVTPDSFFAGSRWQDVGAAVERGLEMIKSGAVIIDIGGESTRPGAKGITLNEELERVIPVIKALRQKCDVPISIDTTKSQVAQEAIVAGANFVNDISGLTFDARMTEVVATNRAGLFLMHTRGRPEVMQRQIEYTDLVGEIIASLQLSIDLAHSAGIKNDYLAVDPGIGFGKSVAGNLEILHNLSHFHQLDCPLLLGTSRKSFIGAIVAQESPQQRLAGSLATVALGVGQGAHIFRVHDVKPSHDAAMVAWAIKTQQLP